MSFSDDDIGFRYGFGAQIFSFQKFLFAKQMQNKRIKIEKDKTIFFLLYDLVFKRGSNRNS